MAVFGPVFVFAEDPPNDTSTAFTPLAFPGICLLRTTSESKVGTTSLPSTTKLQGPETTQFTTMYFVSICN